MSNMLDRLVAKGVKEAEVYSLDKMRKDISFENNKLKNAKTTQNSGIALRTVIDNRMGFITSTNVDDVDKIIDNAVQVTKFSQDKEFDFSSPVRYPETNLKNDGIWDIPEEKLIEDGNRAIEEMKKYDSNLLTSIDFTKERIKVRIENTNGVNSAYEKDTLNVSFYSSVIEGTNFIFAGESAGSISSSYNLMEMAEKTKEKVSLLKKIADFTPGNKTVIVTPEALMMILITLHEGLNGSMIEKGVSPLCGKIGEGVFDERITLIDDGLLENSTDSMPFDDEGTPSQRTVLFEKGVLRSYIHSLRTAAKLNQAPTGNGLKHAGLFPSKRLDAMQRPNISSWVMEPGKTSYEEMVKDIKDGVIIDGIMGIFMNNLLNGDFSGNIGTGYVIKNGRIEGRVKDAAINANIYKLFKNNIIDLSDKVYKTGGSHMLPYVMLKDIYIAGKK